MENPQGLVFLVKGSSPEPYEVIFYPLPFSISCDCTAGKNGLPCKHRLAMLAGQDPGIIEGDTSFLPQIAEATKHTNIFDVLDAWENAKKEKSNARKRTDQAFKNYKEDRIDFLLKIKKTDQAAVKSHKALETAIEEEASAEKKVAEIVKAASVVFTRPGR